MGFMIQPPMNLVAYPIRILFWLWKLMRNYNCKCNINAEAKLEKAPVNGIGSLPSKTADKKPFLSPKTRRKVQDRLHRRYMNAMELRNCKQLGLDF